MIGRLVADSSECTILVFTCNEHIIDISLTFTHGFKQLELLSFMLVELCLVEYEMLKFPPSFIAAAAIYTAQTTLYGVQQWSKTCEVHTTYSEDQLL